MKNFFASLILCLSLSPLASAQIWYPTPNWYYPGMTLPAWQWAPQVQYGYWQCVAFNQALYPFSYLSYNINQAAYGAMYLCNTYSYGGCFIPPGYCQFRYQR
jgi:hypothetical protein